MVEGDEKDVLDRARGGDERAWGELVQRYHRLVASTARRILRNENDVLDVVQDTFTRAFEGIKQYRGEAKFSTWLYRIGLRAAINHARKTRPQRFVPIDQGEIEDYSHFQSRQNERARREDLCDFIRTVLEGFESRRATIIQLRLEEKKCEKIASMLGISVEEVYATNKEFARRCLRLKTKLLRSAQRALAERSP